MYDTLKMFETKFASLKKKGLRVNGLVMVDPKRKKHVISVAKPFLFDNRQIPKRFEGFDVKSQIQGELPVEFQVNREQPDWHKHQYIWAPERFEKYVDRCSDQIRKQFGNPEMTRHEMLDALCFGDFMQHKQKSLDLIKEGKLPAYQEN